MQLTLDNHPAYAYTAGKPIDPARPTVVLVHGAGNDHSVWLLQSRYFAHHGRNVLAVDLPGHNRSAGPPLTRIEDVADWVVRLLDAAGIATAALVGHSMGSLIALEAAARHPDRVSAIALLATAFPMPVGDALLDAARDDRATAHQMINAWAHSYPAQLGGVGAPGLWIVGSSTRLMERLAPNVLHTDLAACNAYRGGLESAAGIACPALLVIAGSDQMTPPKAAKSLAAAIPGAKTVMLETSGHSMMTEQPDRVLDVLIEFLGR